MTEPLTEGETKTQTDKEIERVSFENKDQEARSSSYNVAPKEETKQTKEQPKEDNEGFIQVEARTKRLQT